MRYIAIILMSLLLVGCFNQKAYERLENSYLPQPMPMRSKVKLMCSDNHHMFEPGQFQLIFGYFTSIDSPYSLSNCSPFKQHGVIKETDKLRIASNSQPEYNLVGIGDQWSRKFIPNLNPEKGAVYIWETYAGAQRLDGVISYNLVIYEGKKMPLGAMLRGWSGESTKGAFEKYNLVVNGREWGYFSNRSLLTKDESLWGFQSKAGDVAKVVDYYQTQVGNYTVLVFGIFPQPVTHFPEWLNPRRALLREWVETFKIEPLPSGYITPSAEEIQALRAEELKAWKQREAELTSGVPKKTEIPIDRSKVSAPLISK